MFALAAWDACTWPLESAKQRTIAKAVCYAFNFPTAVIGRITAPYRGIDVFFDRGGEWCDFCSAQQVLWYHLRFAVPVYVALFYVPTLALWIVRKQRARSRREQVAGIESADHA
ncbi:MAG TPA: hypothetical protein VND45_05240 [Thermoanaerobaculia bacterium]|nr:hypothetical protein [Thermoanaerobaculia bacterium]